MIYKPYSIVLVPFPFTDKNQNKKRPALVINSVEHQEQTHHVTLLMITTAKNSAWDNDYLITDLDDAGLNAPSIIRQKIFTLDSRLIMKRLGELSLKDKKALKKILEQHLAI